MNGEKTNHDFQHPIYDRSNWADTRNPSLELRQTVATSNLSRSNGLRYPKEAGRNAERGVREVFIHRAIWIASIASLAFGLKYG